MLMQEALKMLMKMNRVTQERMGEYIGMDNRAVSRTIRNDRLLVSKAIEMLDFMGYELVVREKITGRRAGDEIIINNEPEFREEKAIDSVDLDAPRVESWEIPKYSHEEYVKSKVKDRNWANKSEAAEILGISLATLNKRYGWLFMGNRIPIRKLIQILNNGTVAEVREAIADKSYRVAVGVDDETKEKLRQRIAEVAPGKLFLTKLEIAKITGYSRQTVYKRFGKYFTNGTININEFIGAFQLEGMELK